MTEGDVALTPLPQADGSFKPRPAILLRQMPPFGDWLVCGVSTQLHHEVVGFDDRIESAHADFRRSGLKAVSLIRLGFLVVLPAKQLRVLWRLCNDRGWISRQQLVFIVGKINEAGRMMGGWLKQLCTRPEPPTRNL